MNIDINNLRNKTSEAIAKGKAKQAADEAAKVSAARLLQEQTELVANSIISKIPTLLEEAAAAGRSSCVVFSARNESNHGAMPTVYSVAAWDKIEVTSGLGYVIFKACKEAGLETSCRVVDDGVGMYSWLEIVVSW